MQTLLQADPKLKIVLKELPVLGLASSEAARVAVAVHMQNPAGDKYLAFHQKLLGSQGRVDLGRALEVARQLGLDMQRLERDTAGDQARDTLEENARLARELGINGTPGYVIGDKVVLGAVGVEVLKDKILAARKEDRPATPRGGSDVETP
jgi:protein-disulfide isomerase